jgi:phosphoglycolate phosphatase
MANICAGDRCYDVDFVIFDKDGTLFDFWSMWVAIYERQVDLLRERIGDQPAFFAALDSALGVDRESRRIDPHGPLALATNPEIDVIIAAVLYQHGYAWAEAQRLTGAVTQPAHWPPLEEMVRPIGDVAGLFRRLRAAGVRVAIVTTDAGPMTRRMLTLAGALAYVDTMICADDGLPLKPAPDGILEVCRAVGVPPGRAMLIGDAPTDLIAGKAAGVGVRLGVASGVSSAGEIAPFSDAVIGSIEELWTHP